MNAFFRQLKPALIAIVVMTVLVGVVYPLAITAVAQVAFHDKANGSIVKVDGQAVGSSLIGQQFASPGYLHARPSAAGTGYDGESSSASNLGPHNPDLLQAIDDRAKAYRTENGLPATFPVPVEAVTSSASGLDPQISVANARLQAPRIATTRKVDVATVLDVIGRHTTDRPLGILGDPGVNVLAVNIALGAFAPA